MRQQVVGNGQHGQRAAAVAGGEGVKLCRLHLDAEDAVALHLFVQVGAFVVEHVGRIDAARMGRNAHRLRRVPCRAQQAEIGGGGVVQFAEDAARGGGERGGRHRQHHVADLDPRLHSARRADADQRLRPVVADQFVHVDRERGHAHAGAVDRHRMALPCAGVAQHPAHLVHQPGIVEEGFGRPTRPVGVAGQQDGFGDLAGFRADMDGHGASAVWRRPYASRRKRERGSARQPALSA